MARFSTAKAVDAFRATGRKVTAQRMAVFGSLEGATGHPTVEELYTEVRGMVPGLALKTVYAILHELSAVGLAEPIPLPAGATRWELNTTPHAHFVCDACGRLVDLPVDPTVLLPIAQRSRRHLSMSRPLFLLRGHCDRCDSSRS